MLGLVSGCVARLMKVILVMRGKPVIDGAISSTAAEFGQWIESCARAGVDSRRSIELAEAG